MAPDGHALLALHDQGADADARGRALLLAGLVADAGLAAQLPLGELSRRVWRLRRDFGLQPAADALCNCPHCGETLEFTLPAEFAPPAATTTAGGVAMVWADGEHWLRWPTLADIDARGLDPRRLGPAPWQQPEFVAQAAAALAAADPALATSIALDCPHCGQHFAEDFDACGFLWAELDAHARDLLQQVVQLARAFGWAEDAILGMSAARRAAYLAEIGQ